MGGLTSRSHLALTALVLASLALGGCEPINHPLVEQTTTVRGRMSWSGRPIGPGWVELMPIDGTVGHLRSAPMAADGTFVAECVPIGRVGIHVIGVRPYRSGDPSEDFGLTHLRREMFIHRPVPSGPSVTYDIDVAAEFLQAWQAAQRPREASSCMLTGASSLMNRTRSGP